jgi:hypothetical protein
MKSLSKIQNWCARHDYTASGIFLAAVLAVLFWPVLFAGREILCYDWVHHWYPAQKFWVDCIKGGELPFWCPYTAFGQFFGNANTGWCYPLNVLFFIEPLTLAFAVFSVFHLWLFSFCFYPLARECGLSRSGALIAATVTLVAGQPLSDVDFSHILAGLSWWPLAMLFFIRLLRYGGAGNIAGMAMACAMMVVSGSPYPPWWTMCSMLIVSVGCVLAWRLPWREILRRAGQTGLAGALAFGLSAPFLAPMLAALPGIREFGREGLFPASFSMHPVEWLTVVFPEALSYTETFKCFYAGLPSLLLILALVVTWLLVKTGVAGRVEKEPTMADSRLPLVFGAMALAGAVLALGANISVDKVIDKIPVLVRCNRWAAWIGVLFIPGVAVLAGHAHDRLLVLRERAGWRRALVVTLASAVVLGVLWWLLAGPEKNLIEWLRARHTRFIHSGIFISDHYRLEHWPVWRVIVCFGAGWCLTAGYLALLACLRWPVRRLLPLLLLLLLADKWIFFHTRHISKFSAENVYETTPKIVEQLRAAEPDNTAYRVWLPPFYNHMTLGALNAARPVDYQRHIRELPAGGVLAQYNIYSNTGLGSMAEGSWQYVFGPWLEQLRGSAQERALGLWNVKYIFDANIGSDRRVMTSVRKNPHFQPRAWPSYAARPVTWREALALLPDEAFDARGTVLLLPARGGGTVGGSPAGTPGTADVAEIVYTNKTVSVTAEAERDGWLFLTDPFDHGWRAFVDGEETPVLRANINGRAVRFPVGRHTVKFAYTPPGLAAGLALFLVTASGMAGWFWWQWKRRRRPRTGETAVSGDGRGEALAVIAMIKLTGCGINICV